MVAGRASMRFLDACHWPGSRLVLFIGSSTDSQSCTTAAWCCSCTDHRDQIDSLLACLINADAGDAWPACRDSPHAFLVVLFAASNSRVCVPDCFSFFPFSFFFLWVKFFLSLSLTLYIICTWSPWGWLNALSSGNRTTIDTLSLLPAANFLLSTPTANQTSAYEQAALQAISWQRRPVHKEWRNMSCWANLK